MANAFTQLLEGFGQRLELGELRIEEDTYALLGVEDTLITLQYLEEPDQILMYASVADLPDHASDATMKAYYEAILEGQAFYAETAGATLSISKELGMVLLQIILPMRTLDVDKMMDILPNFVQVAEHWGIRCAELAEGANDIDSGLSMSANEALLMQHMIRI